MNINKELTELRNQRAKNILSEILNWNPEKDDIKQLVLKLEEYRGIPINHDYKILDSIKSSKNNKKKIKIIKDYMEKTGDGDLLIVDKNGNCIADFNYGNPLDHEDCPIIIEHIDDIIADNVSEMIFCDEHEHDDEI